MLNRLSVILAIGLWLVSSGPRAEEIPQELIMFAGQVKTIPAANASRIAVGNGRLLTAKMINDRELLLLGESAGTTSLVVWAGDQPVVYTVRISPGDSQDALRNVGAMLADIPGIQVNPVGTNVVVSGTASKENLVRIAAAMKLYPQLANLAREEEVSMKKMIYMKVQIVEMKRSLSELLGIQWPGSFDGPMVGFIGNLGSSASLNQAPLKGKLPIANSGIKTYLGVSTLIESKINLARNNGDVYVLAEPELSARSGGEAKFLAGGQVPLPSTSTLGAGSVEFKDYGIRLTFRPTADDQGNIRAVVSTEISSIDPSVSVQGIPGFLTRTTESEVNMRSGQTMVMSGLVNTDMAKNASKVPGLGDIPVLGALFRSENFQSQRTDLVIIVTPTVYDPNSTVNRERVEKSLDIRKRFDRQLSGRDIVD